MSIAYRNGISPELARRARAVADRRPILEAMGAVFVSLTKRAFSDATLRPTPWAPNAPSTLRRKKGTLLRESGALYQSIAITQLTNDAVTVSSDRPYAAIQQLGGQAGRGRQVTIPPRPFFPVLNGQLTPEARRRIDNVAKLKIESLTK
jgi:phage virion morphogenesis protein